MYKRKVGSQRKLSAEALNFKIMSAFFQDMESGVSNSYFVKIKTFKFQTSKLLRKRRKELILDVVCSRLYIGEDQEEVQGQCTGQDI